MSARQPTRLYIPTMEILRDKLANYLRSDRKWLRDFLGEFLGVCFLVAVGDASVAQLVLSRGTHSNFFAVTFAWAMAITFGVYISGNTSGGHINPAVTMVMVLLGRTTWSMLLVYWLAQYLGGIVGAGIVYGVYSDALYAYDGGIRSVYGANATAGIFATYPQEFLSTSSGWFDQIVGTAILTMCVFAVTDPRNVEVPQHFLPLLVGLVVGMIGLSYGFNCGFAINPARDMGPRIFTWLAGYGHGVFSYRNYNWFWVPIIGPHVGAVIGTLVYMLFVGIHWPTTFEARKHEARSHNDVMDAEQKVRLTSVEAQKFVE